MSDLPDPLVPADVDLQDFPFMPLQVARLRDSDFAAEEDPEACWYGVLLWAASWHQLPAASLPNNDTVLMKMAGLGRDTRTWKKHRDGALRGFVLCSDGRLYHKTVAEQANEAWEGKMRQRHRTFCATVRKHNERKPDETLEIPSFEDWLNADRPERVADLVAAMSHGQVGNVTATDPQCHAETGSKGQGQGQGQGHPIEQPDGCSERASAPEPELATAKPPSKPKPKLTRLPADWRPAEFGPGTECRSVVDGWPPGELARQVERFTAHHTAKGSRFENWQAAWKTWVLNSREFGHGRANGNGAPDRRDGVAAALDRRLGFDEPPGAPGRHDAGNGRADRGEVAPLRALR